LLLARIATLVLGFTINALLARLLSPRDVGLYFTTYTLVVIGSTVAELGMDRAVVRFVAANIGRGEPGRARNAIGKAFLVGSVGTVALGAILVVSGGHWLPGHVFRSGPIDGALLLAVGWLVGTALVQLSTESLRGLQRFGLTSLFDWLLVDIITATFFAAAWVQGVHLTYGRVVLVSAVATGIAAAVGLLVVARKTRALGGDGSQPIGEMLSVTWPLFVTNLGLFMVNAGVDIWILGVYRRQPEVALYGAAARTALLVAVPFTILLGTVPPLVAELHTRGRRGELERMLRIMATVTTLPAIVACVVFIVFGGPILGRFYGPFYARGATVLAILSLSQLASVALGACGVTLMMTGHQRTMMRVTVGTGLLSVLAAVILAPRFGAPGVAAATACGVLVQNLLQMLFVRRYLRVWTMAIPSIRPVHQFLGRTDEQREARR
jgi:O-antigen/teichoic acid export membrane protein